MAEVVVAISTYFQAQGITVRVYTLWLWVIMLPFSPLHMPSWLLPMNLQTGCFCRPALVDLRPPVQLALEAAFLWSRHSD